MEALLGAGQSNPSCGSVADLQFQLRDLLSSRVAGTRAEHTSVTFEIRATTVFDISVTETENEALENASNIDPLLGGVQANAAPLVNANGEAATRRVKAIDTLVNQPADDPVLQTSVTRHIIASLGQVDGSVWTVRQVSRGEHGWAFTYICKDSWQAWSRQASKRPAKTAIAEWSEKGGQDPVHLARPGFDCRGSVKIAFVKSTKTIDVKYEHTPMHKTVAELIDLLAPPPIAPIIRTPAKKAKEPKPPKEPRPPKTPRASKKRAGEDGAPDGEGTGTKRRRRNKGSLAPIAAAGTILPPEMPGALPVGDSSVRQLYNTHAGTPGAQQDGSGSYPEGLVGGGGDGASTAVSDEVHAHSILNLPPGEAARRRETAIKLLSESNIGPETLSAEQFSIFANQSPELQQDSLTMLMRYGAERLRIVHPTKDASSSGEATPDNQSSPGSAEGASPNPKKSRKGNSEVEGAGADETRGSEATPARHRRICDHCRIKKYKGKCDRARPSCSMCTADGVECVYSAEKPRQNKVAEAGPEAPEQATAEIQHEEPDGLGSLGFHTGLADQAGRQPLDHSVTEPAHVQDQFDGHVHQTGNVSVSESMPHQAETPSDVFNQTHSFYHSSGLSFPHVGTTSAAELAQSRIPSGTVEATSMGYMSNSVPEATETSLHGYTYTQPPATQKTTPGYAEHTTTAVEQGRRGSSGTQASTSRRSLPVGQPSHGSGTNGASLDAQNTWQSLSGTPIQTASATRTSPRQSRKPAPAAQAYDGLPQQYASSWSASQSVTQTSQPTRNSPSQTAAQPVHAKSRQSNRAQTNTPVSSMPAPRQAPADNSGYASATVHQQSTSAQGYTYDQYQSGNTQAESSGDRAGYQPYSSNQTAAQPATYSSFEDYNNRLPSAPASTLPTSGSQNVASSYPSSSATASSAAQRGTSTSNPQSRATHAHKVTQSASGTASYTPQSQPQSLQGFSVRPQPSSAQARGSPGTYSQQLQQQQHKQQQGQQHHQPQQQQQQPQQQQGYNGYMNQQQQQQQQASSSQQNWYGFGAAANSASSGYNSAAAASGNNAYSAAAAASHTHGHGSHGHQAQQQRSMNLSSRTYSSMDGEIYDLLRSNPPG